MPRLATCHICHVLERMPDVPPDTPTVPCILEWTTGERVVVPDQDGHPKMVPAYDPVLEEFVRRHDHDLPDKAVTHGDQIQVIAVDQRTWEAIDMVTTIKTELQQQTGFVYDENQQHREDALKCYNAHGNPDLSSGCRDYLDDSKMIGQGHYEVDGQTLTIPPKHRQYLCYMCPYQQTYIQVELRRRRGAYKEVTPRQARNMKRWHKNGHKH